jgi:hypothetical protein
MTPPSYIRAALSDDETGAEGKHDAGFTGKYLGFHPY